MLLKRKGAVRLYGHYLSINVRSAMQYKTSFFLTALGQFLVSFNVFLGIYFMFRRFQSVGGFTYSEVLLCFPWCFWNFPWRRCLPEGSIFSRKWCALAVLIRCWYAPGMRYCRCWEASLS